MSLNFIDAEINKIKDNIVSYKYLISNKNHFLYQ